MPNAAEIRAEVAGALDHGRLDIAETWCGELLGDGKNCENLIALSRVRAASGDFAAALAYVGEALRLEPFMPDALIARGNYCAQSGAFTQAAQAFEQAQLFLPLNDEVLNALLHNAERAGRPDTAVKALLRRIHLSGETAQLRNVLGIMLHASGDLHGALAAYQRAVALSPMTPLYYSNIATIYYHLERYDEALVELERSLRLDERFPIAWYHTGNVKKAMRRFAEAEQAYRRAVEVEPNYAEAHFALGCVLLQQDAWAEGWQQYEWRWNVPGLVNPIYAGVPLWQGEDLRKRRLMIVAEQGAGDTFQYIRYAKELAEQGTQIYIWAPQEIADLLRRLPFVAQVASNRFELPVCDHFIPAMSLPRLMRKTVDDIPPAPYLFCDPRLKAKFSRELGARNGKLRIGIAWAGNPGQVEDRHRSASLAELAPLFRDERIRWIGVQKGPRVAEIAQTGAPIEDWSEKLVDYDATAALMSALDGVVSVCSSPIHLAGALGVRSIAMLSWSPDWRWRNDDATTPYYDTMRIARMNRLNDWHELAERTASMLATW